MTSNASRGGYYKAKTKRWYEGRGYYVVLTEFMCAQCFGGKTFYRKIDILGADGIAMKKETNEIVFWNSKSTVSGRRSQEKYSGTKDFARFPFPSCVKRQLVIWEPRKPPVVVDCV